MRRVLIVGAGFAGRLHAEAWKRLGVEVDFYDPRLGIDTFLPKLEKADIVDFCDTPLSRAYYAMSFADILAEKEAVFLEKPPFPVTGSGVELLKKLGDKVNLVPVHNYVYMPAIRSIAREHSKLDVVILREAPHKKWYPSALTGGGILADHGYHWLYVADTLLGANILDIECRLMPLSGPDYVASCRTRDGKLRMYLSWLGQGDYTLINGRVLDEQPFSRRLQVESLVALFSDVDAWKMHFDIAIDVMSTIRNAYSVIRRPPEGKEPPDVRELERLLPYPVEKIYDMMVEYVFRPR